LKKGLLRKKRCSWPPPEGDMEEDEDDDDPDGGMDGCDYCIGNKSLNPQLAWNAFYVDGNSLRNSWCIGKRCKDPDWEWYEEADKDKEQEDDIRDEQVTEQQEKVKRCEAATEELNKHSSEFSSASVAAPFSSSSSKPTISCGISVTRPSTFWRPWEDPCEDKAGVGDVVTSQKSLVTPPQPYSSSAMIAATSPLLLTPQGRVFRKAKKRRSAGELVKRRQRLIFFQLSHTPPSTPSKSEPDLSSLESGSWGGQPRTLRLDSSYSPSSRSLDVGGVDLSSPGISLGQRSCMDNYSNQTNPSVLSYPSSPQSWWPSPCLMSSPSPAPSPPPAWLSNNMAPPSPAYVTAARGGGTCSQ
jgi:hypothetical protein